MKRIKTKITDPNHYMPGMAAQIYAGKNYPIKKQKIVQTRKGTKTVDFSPINYYGKQTRTVKKSWK